jgi:hypothetical protein
MREEKHKDRKGTLSRPIVEDVAINGLVVWWSMEL